MKIDEVYDFGMCRVDLPKTLEDQIIRGIPEKEFGIGEIDAPFDPVIRTSYILPYDVDHLIEKISHNAEYRVNRKKAFYIVAYIGFRNAYRNISKFKCIDLYKEAINSMDNVIRMYTLESVYSHMNEGNDIVYNHKRKKINVWILYRIHAAMMDVCGDYFITNTTMFELMFYEGIASSKNIFSLDDMAFGKMRLKNIYNSFESKIDMLKVFTEGVYERYEKLFEMHGSMSKSNIDKAIQNAAIEHSLFIENIKLNK